MRFFGIIYEESYLQTFGVVTRLGRIPVIGSLVAATAKWLCGKISGHEPSNTEWGHSYGGNHADVWCRWCNQFGRISISELDDKYPNARKAIWDSMGYDIKQPTIESQGKQ